MIIIIIFYLFLKIKILIILEKLKVYAYKLSEDFPNFIRVDLYIFHDEIYLSELTFDTFNGYPMNANESIIIETGKNWERKD